MRTVRESFAVSVVGNMIHGHGKYLCEPHSVNSQCTQYSVPKCTSVCLSVPQCASVCLSVAQCGTVQCLSVAANRKNFSCNYPSQHSCPLIHFFLKIRNCLDFILLRICFCNCVSLGYDYVQQTKHTHRVLSGFVAKFSPKTHDIVLLLYCEYRVGKWKFCLNMTLCAALVSNC